MKSRREHQQLDLAIFGRTNGGVHKFMDAAVEYLGAGHRVVYHSSLVLDLLYPEDRLIGLLHLLIDAKVIDRHSAEIIGDKPEER